MGLIVASAENGRVVLGFADSAAEMNAQAAPLVAGGQPPEQIALWTGIVYEDALDLPADWQAIDDYYVKVDGGNKTVELLSARFPLRNAHQERHDLLNTLSSILEDEHPDYGIVTRFFSTADIAKGHDLIYRLHQMGYLVGHKQVQVNGGTTAAHQLAWIAAAAQGPTDAGFDLRNPLTYFDIAHTIAVPTGPFSIVAPADLARRTLAAAVADPVGVGGAGQPAEPTPAQLRDGAWIQGINE